MKHLCGLIHRMRKGGGKSTHTHINNNNDKTAAPYKRGHAKDPAAATRSWQNSKDIPSTLSDQLLWVMSTVFYVALFSALEQTRCAHVACDSE